MSEETEASERCAVIGDPIGAGGEERSVVAGGADGEDPGSRRLSGSGARGGVFDDDAIPRRKLKRGGTFEVRLRMRLAVLDVAGGYELTDKLP